MLTDRTIKAAKPRAAAYLISDEKGLALKVQPGGARSWIMRYMVAGKAHVIGLGSYPEISLGDAREKALDARRQIIGGDDPIAVKRARRAAERLTFQAAAERYMTAHESEWRSPKSRTAWTMTLREYAFPMLDTLPVATITADDVLRVLQPIWTAKPETASRLRGRIEAIIDYAKVIEKRPGDPNPAAWRGNLALTLPKPATMKRSARIENGRGEHHAALPYAELPAFLADLRQRDGLAARCLEFVILTACRTGEAIGATWQEIDEEARLWVVPGTRMKAGRDHRVPLSEPVMALLAGLGAPDRPKMFPVSNMAMNMLLRRMGRDDLTVHGFRSTFSDWCAEQTNFPAEVREMALAHAVGHKVEAAYRRGDLFAKRRELAEAFGRFCAGEDSENVIPLRATG